MYNASNSSPLFQFPAPMQYRPEIDGLRALAVLPVIFFHAGFSIFSGGYVGVDVFFVISGYLITSILLAEKAHGKFSLVRFYERRARRILPALFVVMLVCLPFAWLWLTPAELRSFADSLVAVPLFSSNLLFWSESGYFDTATELKPLLHTWSLAVEEQYYVFFPLFLMLAWRTGKRAMALMLALIGVASLAGAQWGALNHPHATFYLLPTRSWELALGALVAFQAGSGQPRPPGRRLLAEAAGLLGIALIVASILVFDSRTPFPGLYALAPTVGAALVILFAGADTAAGKLLGSRPLVAVGLVSYSAYLWHQPLFAFARLRLFSEPAPLLLGGLVIVVLALAYLTWRGVEQPFRDRERIDAGRVFRFSLAGSALFIGIGVVGHSQSGFPNRFDSDVNAAIAPAKTSIEKHCKLVPFAAEPLLKKCDFGDPAGKSVFVLYGDSHAQALYSEIDAALKQMKVKGTFISNEVCLIPGIYEDHMDTSTVNCHRVTDYLYQFVGANADYLAVGFRWTYRLYPVPGAIEHLLFDNGEGGVERGDAPRQNFTVQNGVRSTDGAGKRRAILDMLGHFAAGKARLFLMYPVPEPGWDVPRLNFHAVLEHGALADTISTSLDAFKKRNQFANDVLDAFPSAPRLMRVRPAATLCDTFVKQRCVLQLGKTPLYYDDDHLSNAAVKLVIAEMLASVRAVEAAKIAGAARTPSED